MDPGGPIEAEQSGDRLHDYIQGLPLAELRPLQLELQRERAEGYAMERFILDRCVEMEARGRMSSQSFDVV